MRGQITLFIIIGIVLLLGAGLLIYYTTIQTSAPIKRTVTVPQNVQGLYDYVSNCMETTAKQAIQLAGTQGGYISLPPALAGDPNSAINNDPKGLSKIPLWYYEGFDRTPTPEFIEQQIALYVRDNIDGCLNNFEPFQEAMEVNPRNQKQATTIMTDNDVVVQLNWNIDAITAGKTTTITEFITTVPVKLRQIHELATKIMQEENKQQWFEQLTIDLMSINTKIPLSGMEIDCTPKRWIVPQVTREIKNTLTTMMPEVRIENTNYQKPLYDVDVYDDLKEQQEQITEDLTAGRTVNWPEDVPPDVFYYNRMKFDIGASETNLKTAFTYKTDWPLLMNVDPRKGNTLSTTPIKGPQQALRLLCINQWHYAYDLVYPIKTTIRDDEAFNGEGYIFQYAFPVIIQNNRGERQLLGQQQFTTQMTGGDFCNTISPQTIDVRARGFVEGSLIAEELEDVNITYQCITQQCDLGQTYSDGSGNIRLYTLLPEGCSTPTIIATKEGYLPAQQTLTGNRVDLFMPKLSTFNYNVIVHPYHFDLDKWQTEQDYTRFTQDMHATISVTSRENQLEQLKIYPSNETIDLIYGDAKYEIDVYLYKNDVMIGGYHGENISISYEDIAGSDTMTFHVPEWRPRIETTHQNYPDRLQWTYEEGLYNGEPYAKKLKPTFS